MLRRRASGCVCPGQGRERGSQPKVRGTIVNDHTPAEQGEIKADLEAMYTAGKKVLPQRARALASVAEKMSGVIDTVNARAAQMGDYAVLLDVLDMAVDCQSGVARSVTTMNNLAAGVVAIADEFVERDDYARQVFNGMEEELRSGGAGQVEVPTEPDKDDVLEEGVGDDYVANPEVDDPDQELEDRNDELEGDKPAFPEG